MTTGSVSTLEKSRDVVVARVRDTVADTRTSMLVAIDGRSGSGKSVLAQMVAEVLGAAVVSGDDFYASDISDAEWDRRRPAARAADVIDWRRLREEALEPLLRGEEAVWRAFDFERVRPDGTYPRGIEPTRRDPTPVIILEGAYSSRPELADLIDLSILVDAPADVRRRRLEAREVEAFLRAWHTRWDDVEDFYFSKVRPASSFDLVVSN